MKKIRINELARELEVKAHLILELLPELGVQEKKTHSSSVDEDVAILLRKRFGFPEGGPGPSSISHDEPDEEDASSEELVTRERREPAEPAAAPVVPAPRVEAPANPEPPPPEPVVQTPLRPPMAQPLRPPIGPPVPRPPLAPPAPMAPVSAAPPAAPAPPQASAPLRPPIPPRPPVMAPPPPVTQSPAAPVPASPQASAPPAAPPVSAKPGQPIAARPPMAGAPRPGQVLSGPRQPFPGGMGEGSRPPIVVPRQTAPAAPGAPIAPRPPAGPSAPPAPGAAPQQPSRPLAGQPIARPVVPPRPDIVAKLERSRQAAPAPSAPRPGAPVRPPQQAQPASPVPGRPIYQGPPRPGQAVPGRPPAAPAARMPGPGGRPGGPGPRPMHPTSRGGPLPPPAPPGPDPQRRPPVKRSTRQDRNRVREQEEKMIQLRASRRDAAAQQVPVTRDISISEGITVKELSEKLDVKANLVIKKLVDKGVFANINQTLESKLAIEVAREFGANASLISFEEDAMMDVEVAEVAADLETRAPVVTIMGHVDHGKTSLLDSIRLANVAEKEAGGITQHIGAYHVEKNGRKIVFIDTPGHEAFTRMRARGAKITDIVILVVAADDGVMPQTLEAIDHAKAAKVPVIVAINKIDKPDAQPERIKQQLSDRGLVPEDWGGDTVMVGVSAKTKENLPTLLEMILLVADLQDLKANPARPAMGSVIESKLDRGRGPVATVLVRNGTLKVGDYFICGSVFGKVRAMLDDRGNQVRSAEPSMPVEVLGLDSLPDAGDVFQVVTDTAKAKQIVLYREAKTRDIAMARNNRVTLESLHQQMLEGEVKELPLIIKADVGGSAEVVSETLMKLSNEKVRIRVLRSGVGAITEADVLLATASNAVIVGFNVRPERNALAVAEQEKVDIRLHSIIYNLTEEIKKAMTGLLEPVFREIYKGKAEVRETFRVTKVGMVAGCVVQDGTITRDSEIRLLRDNVVVHTGKVSSLRRFKDDVSEVKSGMECGITIANYSDVKQGDVIEAFLTERVATEVFA